jgi:copper(I)-binding protein
MMRRSFSLLLFILTACAADEAPLVATDIVIKAPMPGMRISAGYLTLHNNSDAAITITKISSPQFGANEMHETRIEDNVSRMVALAEVTIAAGSAVSLEPGGKHLMLMRPADDLDVVTLDFHAGEDVILTLATKVER